MSPLCSHFCDVLSLCLLRHERSEVPRLITVCTALCDSGSHYPLPSAVVLWGAQPICGSALLILLSWRRLCPIPLSFSYNFLLPYNLLNVAFIWVTFSHPSYNYFKLESFINLLGVYLLVFSLLLSTGYVTLSLLLDTLLSVDNANVTLGKPLAIVTFWQHLLSSAPTLCQVHS